MCMSLNLDYWQAFSLTAGCNLYSKNFKLCVLTVKSAERTIPTELFGSGGGGGITKLDKTMYFRERDKPLVDSEDFLAIAIPKILMGSLIIFLNIVAIISMFKSNRWISINGARKGFYILPQTTQGILNSLFVSYCFIGCLTLYSQISLSAFILTDYRFFENQGMECLVVNSIVLSLSLSIAFHLVSLSVDRSLACNLNYQKYSNLSKGTVPLWLVSIWTPSIIVGILPIAGWKTNFSFCIFYHQFSDDYLRFVSGFFLSILLLIPCLYLFFVAVLKQRKDLIRTKPLYRYHRKLQAHHRLTFILVMTINSVCLIPFHIYILLTCLSCPFASFASGFTLEYLFMLGMVPSFIIPLLFSIRSNAVDKCAKKISRCVHFRFNNDGFEEEDPNYYYNPLSNKTKQSPLFFIDDLISSGNYTNSGSTYTTNVNTCTSSSNQSKSHLMPEESYGGGGGGGRQTFTPHSVYLPDSGKSNVKCLMTNTPYNLMSQINSTRSLLTEDGGRKVKNYNKKSKSNPRNFSSIAMPRYENEQYEKYTKHSHSHSSLYTPSVISDKKYGFPINKAQLYVTATSMGGTKSTAM